MDMYIGIASKMLIGSLGVFIVIRLIGKKATSELTPFDLLYVIILGALVEEALYDDKVNVLHVIFAIALWGCVVYLVERILEKTEKMSSLVQGEPSVLIEKGKLNVKELRENYLDMEQLRAILRQHNCYSIHEVYYAILEINGSLTVIPKEKKEIPTFLLVEEGAIKFKTLTGLGKSEEWLRTTLVEMGYSNIEEIIYCEWDETNQELLVGTYGQTINKSISLDD